MPWKITAVSFIIPENGNNSQKYLDKYQYASTLDRSAYIKKLFSIAKDEPQLKNDWIQIIYEEKSDQPIGILVQNQISDIGINGVNLGMSAKEIMGIYPEAVEQCVLYDEKTVKYILLEDENYRYYYVETGGFGETTKLYIEKI